MKRPASRSVKKSEPKAPANVVQLFGDRPTKKTKAPKKNLRRQAQRLNREVAGVRSRVASVRPSVSFGKRIFLVALASVLALVIVVAVAIFSPLLAVRKIEIVGTNRVSDSQLQKDLAILKGIPLPQITSDAIASKLSKYRLIDSVSAISVPPNTLRVVVVERSPIGIVQVNGINYLYDPTGVQIGRALNSDRYPTIESNGDPASSSAFKQAVSVLLKIPLSILSQVSVVNAVSRDNVSLHLRSSNQKILWGDDSKPGLKATVLLALMKHYVGQWGITYDVSSPSQPSVY